MLNDISKAKNSLKILFTWIIYGGTALFIFVIIFRSWNQIRGLEWQINLWYLTLALILAIFYFASWDLCWFIILRAIGVRKKFIPTIRANALSQLFRYIPGNLWSFVSRASFSKKIGISNMATLFGVSLEAVLIVSTGIVISLLAMLHPESLSRVYQEFSVWIFVILFLILISPWVFKILISRIKTLSKARLHFNFLNLIPLSIFYFASWLIFGSSIFFLIKSLTSTGWDWFWWIVGVSSLSWLIGYLTLITPSGVGGREAALILFLRSLFPLGLTTIMAFLSRIIMIAGELLHCGIIVLVEKILIQDEEVNLLNHYQRLVKTESDFRWEALQDLILPELKKGNVLDLGCGPGTLSLFLATRGFEVTAADPDPKILKLAKARLKNTKVKLIKAGTGDLWKLKKKFDNVIFIDVLEHIKNDEIALKNIIKQLKPGGRFIILVPALKRLYGTRDKSIGHWRRYGRIEIKKKIQKSGLKIKKIRYWNFIGLIPYFFFEKILKKRIKEKFRYQKSPLNSILKKSLSIWLKIENKIPLPSGLSLLIIVEREK